MIPDVAALQHDAHNESAIIPFALIVKRQRHFHRSHSTPSPFTLYAEIIISSYSVKERNPRGFHLIA
jgi:hypothetical protein